MRRILLVLLVFVPSITGAEPIEVGTTAIEVPPPIGFSAARPEMQHLYEDLKNLVPPESQEYFAFIPNADIPAVAQGAVPRLRRRFSIRAQRSLIERSVSKLEFQEMRELLKDLLQAENSVYKIEPSLRRELRLYRPYRASSATWLPQHEESEVSLSFSGYFRAHLNAPLVASTSAIVLVRGKVLHLQGVDETGDLEWTRAEVDSWMRAVLMANQGEGVPIRPWSPVGSAVFASVLVSVFLTYLKFWQRGQKTKKQLS